MAAWELARDLSFLNVVEARDDHHDENARQVREDQNRCNPLLSLAAELRNKIFVMALPSNRLYNTTHKWDWIERTDPSQSAKVIRSAYQYKNDFGLTQVSRLIREETLKIAYGGNHTFILGAKLHDTRLRADRWIASRPPEILPLINKVILQYLGKGLASCRCNDAMDRVFFNFEEKTAVEVHVKKNGVVCMYAAAKMNVYDTIIDKALWERSDPRKRLLWLIRWFRGDEM